MGKIWPKIIASPLLCAALLGGIAAQNRTHLTPEDVGPFHARAKAAIEAMPRSFTDKNGDWTSEEHRIEKSAEELLHPNCVLSLSYTNQKTHFGASLLIVQCRDLRDMAGHYPPICYPAQGERMTHSQPFEMPVGDPAGHKAQVLGMEYHFIMTTGLTVSQRYVYDFFIVPGKGFVRDMADIRQSAKDYQRRYLGAAQFQVVFSDPPAQMSPAQREEVVKSLLGANAGVFEVLNTVGTP